MFLNSEHSNTYKAYRIKLNLMHKIDPQRGDSCIALSNVSIYYTWKNIKQNNISCPTWDEKFELPEEYIFKTILNTLSKSMKHWQISQMSRYTSTEFTTELYSKLSLGTILNS